MPLLRSLAGNLGGLVTIDMTLLTELFASPPLHLFGSFGVFLFLCLCLLIRPFPSFFEEDGEEEDEEDGIWHGLRPDSRAGPPSEAYPQGSDEGVETPIDLWGISTTLGDE
jgi:hypothetical protein